MSNSIFGYSDGYISNPFYYQGGQTAYKIFEPKTPFPEKAGFPATNRTTILIPISNLLGTGVVATDFGYIMPLPAGVRVTALDMDITVAATATGAFTANVGNNTSATAYLSAIDLTTAANTAATRVNLDAASAGVGNNDSVIIKFQTVVAPVLSQGTIIFTISYSAQN